MPTKSPELVSVATALARVLRRGLPITPAVADPVLLDLRGVIARAINPDDIGSRMAALDGVLRGLLARFPTARYAEAARALFGLSPAEPGQTLTVRRQVAAVAAHHEVHHFRKRVEARLIGQLASALLSDADRFTQSRAIAPRLAPTRDRRPVPADPFAWEVVEHEEALSRLWAATYALRAELLSVERLLSLDVDREHVTRRAVSAAWRWALASAEADSYAIAFGAGATGGEVSAHDLVALAGWTPPLSPEQQSRLRAAAAGGADLDRFVAALYADTELGHAWIDALLAPVMPGNSTNDMAGQTS